MQTIKSLATGMGVALAVGSGVPVNAQYIVNTGLTTGDNQWAILGEDRVLAGVRHGYTVAWAAPFSLTTATRITGLEAGLWIYETGRVNLTVFNAATGLPQTSAPLIDVALALSPLDNNKTYPNVDWQGATGLNTVLAAGDYWFAVLPSAGSTIFAGLGRLPASPLPGVHLDLPDVTGWRYQLSSYKFDVRISGEALGAGAIPEPASWAMLIAGFGLTGAAARRRRGMVRVAAA